MRCNSSSGMPYAERSAGHAPLGTSCHAVDGIWEQYSKSNFCRGELRKTSSRSAAPSAPLVSLLKHLECSKGERWDIQSSVGRWHIEKGTFMPCKPQLCKNLSFVGGDKEKAICCRCSCKWLLQVRPFATVYFTFLACQCCQMLSKKQPWHWPLTLGKKHRVSTNWPNIATKFARRGARESLLLSNWSSWRRAASATQWTEFDRNPQSSTSPGESCARLPAGLWPHRHWCLGRSTWSDQKGDGGDKRTAICCRSSCNWLL